MILETQISPIFGLTLVGLIEISTFILAIAAIIGIIFTAANSYLIRKQTNLLKDQIEREGKISSARFIIDYADKILEKNRKVIGIVYSREVDPTIKFSSDKDVRVLLNGFENIVQFINDGLIDKNQALNTLKIILCKMKKDSEVDRIIKETRKETKDAFELIVEFMKKIN